MGAIAAPADAGDQAMPVEDGVDSALSGHPKVTWQAPNEQLAQLAGAPMRLVALEADDHALDLRRQLVGVADRPTGSIVEGGAALLLVSTEDFVAGLSGDPELTADVGHSLTLKEAGDEAQAFIHSRTLFPRHQHLRLMHASGGGVTHVSGTMCHPCLGSGR